MEEQVHVTVSTGVLHGTLLVPEPGTATEEGAWSVPVVLMLAGSGPTDRDGHRAGSGRVRVGGSSDPRRQIVTSV